MKLFFIIYVLGKVVGTVGPLPYSLEECKSRAVEAKAVMKTDATPKGVKLADVTFACELHDTRPAIEYKVKG